jgi:hypothetical protein
MRFEEFSKTKIKNIRFVKFQFEKILHALLVDAKKDAKNRRNKKKYAKDKAKINKLKANKENTVQMQLNMRPKRE